MAAATPAIGLSHPTVVPTNFDPDDRDEERASEPDSPPTGGTAGRDRS